MERKYVLTDETIEYSDHILHRIKAVKDFGIISAGTLGGYIENETNLDHDGKAWVNHNAKVYGNARIYGNARVSDIARVYGNAQVFGNAWVRDSAEVHGSAEIRDNARVYENAKVYGDALIYDNTFVYGHAMVYGCACIRNANICGVAEVYGDTTIIGDIMISGNARLSNNTDYAVVCGFGRYFRATTFFKCSDDIVRCQCGCFYGTIDKFRAKVRETHGSSKYAKEYLMIADLMELHFNKGEDV